MNPKDRRHAEEYLRSFVDSNIGSITQAVRDVMKSYRDVLELRILTAHIFIRYALEACKDSIERTELDKDELCERTSELRGIVDEVNVWVRVQVSGTDNLDEVRKALKEAEKEMKSVYDLEEDAR